MKFKSGWAACIALLAVATSCQVDEIQIPASELYTREFIKNFGIIDPSHDWSVVTRGSVTVNVAGNADVSILADIDGSSVLLANYSDISGTHEIRFDCPKDIDKVVVKCGPYMEEVALGGSIDLNPAMIMGNARSISRGIDGTDNLAVTSENGFFWESKYVKAISDVLPEGKVDNIIKETAGLSANFIFTSSGKPFTFYPIFWNTTGRDVLGVYWYEGSQIKTKDLFSNTIVVDGTTTNNLHNIYYRDANTKSLRLISSYPQNNEIIAKSGNITLNWNFPVELIEGKSITINGTPLSTTLSADRRTATCSYSGLAENSEVKIIIPAGTFKAQNNVEDESARLNREITITCATEDNRSKWVSTSFTSGEKGAGLATLTFDKEITLGSGNISISGGDENISVSTSDVTLSADGKTLTVPFKVTKFSTTYTMTVPDGFLSNVNLTGYDSKGANTFETSAEPGIQYEETLHQVNIKDFESTKFTKDTDILGDETLPFTATAKVDEATSKKDVSIYTLNPEWFFGDGISFTKGMNVNCNKSITSGDGFTTKNNAAKITIIPQEDMKLTVYFGCLSSKSKPTDRMEFGIISSSTLAGAITTNLNTTGTTTDSKTYALGILVHELKANVDYVLYARDADSAVCGFAYQKKSETQETAYPEIIAKTSKKAAMRQSANRSRATNAMVDLGINGQKWANWDNGDDKSLKDQGFMRNSKNGGVACSSTKNTLHVGDVLTHKISFTLPKGVRFGFYLRNESGANNVTNKDNNTTAVPYVQYCQADLNRDMPNSFFNNLNPEFENEYPYYINGWDSKHNGLYHERLRNLNLTSAKEEILHNRSYCSAMTYVTNVDGAEMRYFSFEDYVDIDFNDIAFLVAPETADDVEVVDNEIQTNPYIFAVEDLGATRESDIDFNDVVFAVEHVKTEKENVAFVTVLAAGGTLKTHLLYNGQEIGNEIGEIVHGPHMGTTKKITHINEWLDRTDHTIPMNVGLGEDKRQPYGVLTTVRITVSDDFSLADAYNETGTYGHGFTIKVERKDGTFETITRPNDTGEAPQMLILPKVWFWPNEEVSIKEAYPGGVNNGTPVPSFTDWVTNAENRHWYEGPVNSIVYNHPWKGSQAARTYIKELEQKKQQQQ